MKVCSKCGRTFPIHVDFCLRDGHPLVLEEPAPPPAAVSAPADPAEGEAIDFRTTTDAFLPSLSQASSSSPAAPSAPAAPSKPRPAPETAPTEVISVARIRQITQSLKQELEAPAAPAAPDADPPPSRMADPQDFLDVIERTVEEPLPTGPRVGLSVSGMHPRAEDPQSLIQTTLIPRNWRATLQDLVRAEAEGMERTPTPTPTSDRVKLQDVAAEPAPEEVTTSADFETADDADGEASDGEAGVVPPLDPSAVDSAQVQVPLAADGATAAVMFAPQEEGIPSGFEAASPPEEDDEENTGALSQPFISGGDDDDLGLVEEEAPWAARGAPPVILPRGHRAPGEIALEDEPRLNGAAPPKGSFRRRAAFSHWPAPPIAEEGDLAQVSAPIPVAEPVRRESPRQAPALTPEPRVPQPPPKAEQEELRPAVGRVWLGIAAVLLVSALAGLWALMRDDAPPAAPAADVRGAAEPGGVDVARDAGIPPSTADEAAAVAGLPAAMPTPLRSAPTPAHTPVEPPPAAAVQAAPPPAQTGAAAPQKTAQKAPRPTGEARASAQSGKLSVQEPAGATVYVDDRSRGVAPLTVDLAVGTHLLRLEKAGFAANSRKVTIQAGQTSVETVPLKAVEVPRMKVLISSNVNGAEILVDGKPAGKTPTTVFLTPGAHEVELRSGGREPKRETVVVPSNFPKDKLLRVSIEL